MKSSASELGLSVHTEESIGRGTKSKEKWHICNTGEIAYEVWQFMITSISRSLKFLSECLFPCGNIKVCDFLDLVAEFVSETLVEDNPVEQPTMAIDDRKQLRVRNP